jgi:hypothetical protein
MGVAPRLSIAPRIVLARLALLLNLAGHLLGPGAQLIQGFALRAQGLFTLLLLKGLLGFAHLLSGFTERGRRLQAVLAQLLHELLEHAAKVALFAGKPIGALAAAAVSGIIAFPVKRIAFITRLGALGFIHQLLLAAHEL